MYWINNFLRLNLYSLVHEHEPTEQDFSNTHPITPKYVKCAFDGVILLSCWSSGLQYVETAKGTEDGRTLQY